MRVVFLDTVGLLALWDESDQWHAAAHQAFIALRSSRTVPQTTTLVLLECGNAAARRPYRQAVARLRRQLDDSNLVITPNSDDWRQAWEAYERGDAAEAGIVDQISFAVMRRSGLTEAFTHDGHFRAAGFATLF